ncbi:hypothetical protein EMCG_01821 [[Emmonsia] crescens]|uniref:Uncharacterized protein n=1 Tax=[Emmonsia] crescens TaxID=73230 RepID=A0A0G2I0G6_9EURO|nr:hypothetical protein EMCG_01821 [Emmonsia crescens UAMH 3008]
MVPRSRPDGPDDKESRSKSHFSPALDAIFESGTNSDPSEDENDCDDSDDDVLDDESQLPPEHYLAEAENLDVSQLPEAAQRPSPRET